MANFETAFAKTLKFEGGYSLNLHDQITTYAGISRLISPYWEGWRYTDNGKIPPKEEVKDYYYLDVWCRLWCHRIEDQNVAWSFFDFAVTSKQDTAIKALQRCVGVRETGNVGCTTVEMANCFDEDDLQTLLAFERIEHYIKADQYDRMVQHIKRALAGIDKKEILYYVPNG